MYIRSSISAQSLASVPPSRALMVRIAPLESKGPFSSPLSSSCVDECFEPVDFGGDLGDERRVFVGHLDQRFEVGGRGDRLVERLEQRVERI